MYHTWPGGKASAPSGGDIGIASLLSLTISLRVGSVVATLTDVWCYRVNAWTCWLSLLGLCEIASSICNLGLCEIANSVCNLCLSVAAGTTV